MVVAKNKSPHTLQRRYLPRPVFKDSAASIRTLLRPPFEIAAEQPGHIALDFGLRNLPAILYEPLVGGSENRRHCPARIAPLIDQLLENARVRMLRDKTGAQHFQTFARNLFDDRWVVQEPPAAKRKQIAELPGIDT